MQLPKLDPLSEHRIPNFATPVSWYVSEPQRFMALMAEVVKLVKPGYYLGDNLFTWARNNSLFEDLEFRRAWESNIASESDQAIAWRRYILASSAYHCAQLPGDFVECGVYSGSGMKTVMDYLGGPAFDKTFWGYDTYDYNPVEGHAFAGQEAGFFERVQQRFTGYPVRLVRGLIPDSFAQGVPEKIAFLHIDLNSADAELAVLEHFFGRVVPGGMIILDDYEWAGPYRKQKQAEDPWFDARGYRVMPLPTGQGIIVKR
jgi:hypothetical protein